MEHFNTPLKIGVIDEKIEPNILKILVPYYLGEISIIQCNGIDSVQTALTTKIDLPINHSTLCTALLIEGLHRKDILDKVQITNISIANGFGENTLQALINALDYCKNHNFDLLSISVGVLNLLYGKQMIPLLQQLKKTVVVAAAANDFSLTYPAAFPTVIGVKRAVHKAKILIEVVEYPLDGIELIMSYKETRILQKLYKEYQLDYKNSNSILVPQVCAEIANYVIQTKIKLKKNCIIDTFAKLSGFSDTNQRKDYSYDKELDDSIPIVLVNYDSTNQKKRYLLLKKLQKIFENNGYSCGILCDFIKESDYENGWYRICSKIINQEIEYYLSIISDSILFLLLSNETNEGFSYDISIKEDALPHSLNKQEIDKLFNKIIDALS